MARAYTGESASDRAFAKFEKAFKSNKYVDRTYPISLAELEKQGNFSLTFDGRYPGFGKWETDLMDYLASKYSIRHRDLFEVLGKGINSRIRDTYEKKVEVKDFAKTLKDELKW